MTKDQQTNRPTDQQTTLFRLKLAVSFAMAVLFLATIVLRAAWTEPTQAPPAGNAAVPLYSTGSQSLDGSLSAGTPGSYATGLSGSGSTSGVQGNSTAGNAVFGNLATGGAGGQRAIYGLAVDANDYALYASGGLGLGLASGDIWFSQRDAGIGFSHINAAYGSVGALKVVASGETQIRSLGGGINFMKVTGASPGTLTSLLTVSEAGVVNVASGGALKVNNVNVCLQDGTNCSSISTPNLQAVTDAGNSTTKDILSTGLIQGQDVKATRDFLGNALKSQTGGADNIWLGDTNDIIQIQSDLKVGDGGAFGGYDPSASHKVTTPSFYGLTAEVGDIKINKLNSAYGSDGAQNAATTERQYKILPLIDNNDYFCPVGFVVIGVRNTNPAQLICGKLW